MIKDLFLNKGNVYYATLHSNHKGMDVGNGVQAYITYLNYDSPDPTFDVLKTKADRRAALSRYCQQDTWAMVEILRVVRGKI